MTKSDPMRLRGIQAWQKKAGLLTYFLPDKKENEKNIPAEQKKKKKKSWFSG